MSHPFRLYGHRGDAAHHPENTMRAFRAAVDKGVDALETDVRLTADGEVVVFHDATGQRTCGRSEALIATPWSVVQTWDAGDGEHPVLLAELLDTWPHVFVNVDIKDDREQAALRILDVVRRAGREPTVGLATFHAAVASAVHRAGWRGQMGLVSREVAAARLLPSWLARPFVSGNAAQIPTHRGRFRLDGPAFIDRCHRLGLRVDYWTIDDPVEAVRLVRAGADGIVSNDPAAVGKALKALKAITS